MDPRRRAEIAAFQANLLEALAAEEAPQEIIAKLLANSSDKQFKESIKSMDADMLELGSLLVKKWGLRKGRKSQ